MRRPGRPTWPIQSCTPCPMPGSRRPGKSRCSVASSIASRATLRSGTGARPMPTRTRSVQARAAPGRRDRRLLEAVLPQPQLVEVPVGRRGERAQGLRRQGRHEHDAEGGDGRLGHGCLTSSTRKPLLDVSRVHGIASSVWIHFCRLSEPEVALHDEVGDAARRQPGQPGAQQVVQHGLADPDRRVGPDQVEAHVVRDAVGGGRAHAVEPQRGGVAAGQVEGPLVDVEGPDRGGGGAQGQGERDRAPSRSRGRGRCRWPGARVPRRAAPRCPCRARRARRCRAPPRPRPSRPARRTRSRRRSSALAGAAVK